MSPPLKIVVVEDDREMRQSLDHILNRADWDVETYADAKTALARLPGSNPDVILSDVQMPGMSGLKLLAALDEDSKPPLVLISAHGDISMAVQAMQDGAYSFLEKPFDPRRLLSVLSHAAENHRLLSTTRRLRTQLSELSGIDRVLLGGSRLMVALRNEVFELAGRRTRYSFKAKRVRGKS